MDVKRGDLMATIWINSILHGERKFAEFGPVRTHNNLVNLINKSGSINAVLEKGVLHFYGL